MGNRPEQSIGEGHEKLKENVNLGNPSQLGSPESRGAIGRDPVASGRGRQKEEKLKNVWEGEPAAL